MRIFAALFYIANIPNNCNCKLYGIFNQDVVSSVDELNAQWYGAEHYWGKLQQNGARN